MAMVFISHANKDKPLVEAFVALLEGGVGVPPDEIFCSSLKGQGVRPGAKFVDSIRDHLEDSTVVAALISENFYHSAFCMCELGGVWLASKNFLPVLVPPLKFKDLKAVLEGTQALRLNSAEDLDELRDEIVAHTGLKPLATVRWNMRRDAFLRDLEAILASIDVDAPVPRDQHEKLQEQVAELQEELEAGEMEQNKLRRTIQKLVKTKNAKEAQAVLLEESETPDQFHELAEAAKDAIGDLDSVAQETLYHHFFGEDYSPADRDDWDAAKRSIQNGTVVLNNRESGFELRTTNKKVRKAIKAVADLRDWMDESPEDFHTWYDETFGGEEPDITLRPFWDRHLM